MWTYSGFFIQKRFGKVCVFSDNKEELEMFSENGELLSYYKEDIENGIILEDDCLYQVWIGYGTMSEPKIYRIKRLFKVDWKFVEEEIK